METYLEYQVEINGLSHAVVVSEEHAKNITMVVVTLKSEFNFASLIGAAACNPKDEFNLDAGVRVAVERIANNHQMQSVWHGFRRAQWKKLHEPEETIVTQPAPELPDNDPTNPWIPVDERLPEISKLEGVTTMSDYVQALTDNRQIIDKCYCCIKTGSAYKAGHWFCTEGETVTHWRYIRGAK